MPQSSAHGSEYDKIPQRPQGRDSAPETEQQLKLYIHILKNGGCRTSLSSLLGVILLHIRGIRDLVIV